MSPSVIYADIDEERAKKSHLSQIFYNLASDFHFLFPCGTKIPGNKTILAMRSPKFERMFFIKRRGITLVSIANVPAVKFRYFLDAILGLVTPNIEKIIFIMPLCRYYEVSELEQLCLKILKQENLGSHLIQVLNLGIAEKNLAIIKTCMDSIAKIKPETLFIDPRYSPFLTPKNLVAILDYFPAKTTSMVEALLNWADDYTQFNNLDNDLRSFLVEQNIWQRISFNNISVLDMMEFLKKKIVLKVYTAEEQAELFQKTCSKNLDLSLASTVLVKPGMTISESFSVKIKPMATDLTCIITIQKASSEQPPKYKDEDEDMLTVYNSDENFITKSDADTATCEYITFGKHRKLNRRHSSSSFSKRIEKGSKYWPTQNGVKPFYKQSKSIDADSNLGESDLDERPDLKKKPVQLVRPFSPSSKSLQEPNNKEFTQIHKSFEILKIDHQRRTYKSSTSEKQILNSRRSLYESSSLKVLNDQTINEEAFQLSRPLSLNLSWNKKEFDAVEDFKANKRSAKLRNPMASNLTTSLECYNEDQFQGSSVIKECSEVKGISKQQKADESSSERPKKIISKEKEGSNGHEGINSGDELRRVKPKIPVKPQQLHEHDQTHGIRDKRSIGFLPDKVEQVLSRRERTKPIVPKKPKFLRDKSYQRPQSVGETFPQAEYPTINKPILPKKEIVLPEGSCRRQTKMSPIEYQATDQLVHFPEGNCKRRTKREVFSQDFADEIIYKELREEKTEGCCRRQSQMSPIEYQATDQTIHPPEGNGRRRTKTGAISQVEDLADGIIYKELLENKTEGRCRRQTKMSLIEYQATDDRLTDQTIHPPEGNCRRRTKTGAISQVEDLADGIIYKELREEKTEGCCRRQSQMSPIEYQATDQTIHPPEGNCRRRTKTGAISQVEDLADGIIYKELREDKTEGRCRRQTKMSLIEYQATDDRLTDQTIHPPEGNCRRRTKTGAISQVEDLADGIIYKELREDKTEGSCRRQTKMSLIEYQATDQLIHLPEGNCKRRTKTEASSQAADEIIYKEIGEEMKMASRIPDLISEATGKDILHRETWPSALDNVECFVRVCYTDSARTSNEVFLNCKPVRSARGTVQLASLEVLEGSLISCIHQIQIQYLFGKELAIENNFPVFATQDKFNSITKNVEFVPTR